MLRSLCCATAVVALLALSFHDARADRLTPGEVAGTGAHPVKRAETPPEGVLAAAEAISGSPIPGVLDHVLKRPHEGAESSDFVPVTVNINYPSLGRPDIDADIRDWATGIADAFERHFDGTILAPVTVPEDADMDMEQAAPAPVSLDLQASYTVSRPSANAVSITFELWNYTGGPNGNMDVITLNYSLITGQRLDLVDIFELPETALQLMSSYCRKELGKTMGGQRLMDGTEALPENFASLALTRQGVRIHFQPYQVAGWEMGAQTVDMPLVELMPAGPLQVLWAQ